MKKLVSILMILAMIVPLAGAQSTDIFKKKKKKKSRRKQWIRQKLTPSPRARKMRCNLMQK